jgi:DNA polymerase-3 subunit alpha
MGSFTHLHLHSQYSLLDGAIRLRDLFPRLHQLKMNAVALTDHGNMFGALDFYKTAQKHSIKPIIGCEVYVAEGAMSEKTARSNYHLVLLAKNQEGYRNLRYLVSRAYLEGFYYVPRLDKTLLRKHAAGLVGLSACLGGEIAQTMFNKGKARAEEIAREYVEIFEEGSFFLEVQPNGLTEQDQLNEELTKIARRHNIRLVATADAHYLERKDAIAHDCLMCIQTGKLVSDTNRLRHEVDEYFLKSQEEMERAFYNLPEALENTVAIAEMCNVELDLNKTYLPSYPVPEQHDLESYLAQLARSGLAARLAELGSVTVDQEAYEKRLELELRVINTMGFASYFLIVWDFIRFAKEQKIPVGPGRGSGAGSLVAYCLRITDIDPMRYDLLFERFLNPHRVSMPDFDIDFCMNRRDEVIAYVTKKYGRDNVGQIVTMHQLKARGVTRDVARALGMSYAEGDLVAKLIPEPIQGKSLTIPEAMQQEPRLRALAEENAKVAELLEIATGLEGLNRHAGTHAAGVVIGDKPLWEYVPCFGGQNGELITQFAKTEVEEAGLVKFDFLGLRTLTVLACAAENIARTTGLAIDLTALPMDDLSTFKMIQEGDTTGVFQMESAGFKELLKKLRPDCFEDIIAAVALYRPGPLEGGMVDDFIKRKHGQTRVQYLHPWLEGVLKETYGVIVYQEQVMQIASALAGFDLGRADLLRRAMGKKKLEEMAEQKKAFLQGAVARGVPAKQAAEIFDLMEAFARYGFNKSHSAAYALISYRTAYLKCHYPEEFMAAVLTSEKDNSDNLTKFIAAARSMGIEVLRPEVNESEADFSVISREGKKYVRFGLGAVRNVGANAVAAIVEARRERPFSGLFEFCERVSSKNVNKRVVEALISAGAFDGIAERLQVNRAQLTCALDAAQERAAAAARDRETGQTNLFGMLADGPKSAATAIQEVYPDVPDWQPRKKLALEKESLGFYVSGHPLDRFAQDLARYADTSIANLATMPERADVSVGGLVAGYRERPLRTGKGRMAIFALEDQTDSVEVVCFSRPFEEFEAVLKADEPLLISGRVVFEGEGEHLVPRLQMKSAATIAALRQQKTSEMQVHLSADRVGEDQLESLKQILLQHVGECRTRVILDIPKQSQTQLTLSERYSVSPTDDLLLKIEQLFGSPVATLK